MSRVNMDKGISKDGDSTVKDIELTEMELLKFRLINAQIGQARAYARMTSMEADELSNQATEKRRQSQGFEEAYDESVLERDAFLREVGADRGVDLSGEGVKFNPESGVFRVGVGDMVKSL